MPETSSPTSQAGSANLPGFAVLLRLIRAILLFPALLIACFRPYVGGYYVTWDFLAAAVLILLPPFSGWLLHGETLPAHFAAWCQGLLLLSFAAFLFNRNRHFRRWKAFGVPSTFAGVWPWGIAPTWLWAATVLPAPFVVAGLLALAQGWGLAGKLLLWTGLAISAEGWLVLRVSLRMLVSKSDAEALSADDFTLTDPWMLSQNRARYEELISAPMIDPQTGRPNYQTAAIL